MVRNFSEIVVTMISTIGDFYAVLLFFLPMYCISPRTLVCNISWSGWDIRLTSSKFLNLEKKK
jgi:hypothetical protein